jgi:prepilin-type N-terminal cleavage/methylation domain-containing protein/prepilin-type processing-associated H-X9-DG protein
MSVAHRCTSRRAFTLVELLVVIAIIGILMSLVMPAIQGARETARVTQCQNNLGQMAKATMQYETTWKTLPSGGWGPTWIGMPPYQLEKQMGGWMYQLLPYAEENNLATLQTPDIKSANAKRAAAVIPWLYCPTRRSAVALPYSTAAAPTGNGTLLECNSVTDAGRNDYAANVGNSSANACEDLTKFPQSLTGSQAASTWIDFDNKVLNGAVVQRRGLRTNDFSDGRFKTYLYGEKVMDQAQVDTGKAAGDVAPALSGFGSSIMRSTNKMMTPDSNGLSPLDCRFGSAHPGGSNFAFADGAVRLQDYGMDPLVFSSLGARNDSKPTNEGDYIK